MLKFITDETGIYRNGDEPTKPTIICNNDKQLTLWSQNLLVSLNAQKIYTTTLSRMIMLTNIQILSCLIIKKRIFSYFSWWWILRWKTKSSIKIVKRGNINITNTQIHDRSISWLGTGHTINKLRVLYRNHTIK